MILKQIFSQNAHWQINKDFAREFGLDCAILFSDLVDKNLYFAEKNENFDGWFYNTAENIERDTTLSEYKQSKALKVLEEHGFIETKLKGIPAKKNFKILENNVLLFLKQVSEKLGNLNSRNLNKGNKNKDNKNKEREREKLAQKNSEPIINIKTEGEKQEDLAPPEIRAIDFLKQNYPTRYEQQFKMRFYKSIKDQKEFVDSFNDKVDIEELPYKSNVLFARLNSYAKNWVKNKDKFTPKNKNAKNGML